MSFFLENEPSRTETEYFCITKIKTREKQLWCKHVSALETLCDTAVYKLTYTVQHNFTIHSFLVACAMFKQLNQLENKLVNPNKHLQSAY